MRHSLLQAPFYVLVLLLAVLLSGCGVGASNPIERDVPNDSFQGTVIGGQNPISGATISVYSYGASGYGSAATLLASTTTDTGGAFNFSSGSYTCPTSTTPVYILSVGGDAGSGVNANAVLGAALGTCTHAKSSFLILNEVSTVGLAYALSHFFNPTLGGTAPANDSFGGPSGSLGLANANNTTANLIAQLTTGYATPSSGNMTTEDTKVFTIANILAACVNSSGQTSTSDTTSGCGRLFNFTTPPGASVRPSDTLQAAVVMALYPTQFVNNLFLIPTSRVPFPNDLSSQPADWSVAVKFTGSGFGLGLDASTLTSLDIDSTGRVWFPSNASGAVGAAFFDPASSSFNGPYNGTSMTHPEQVAIDGSGYVWLNDTLGTQISGYNTTSPTSFAALSLANTASQSITIGHDNRVNVGLFDSGLSKFRIANVSTNRLSYTEQTTGLITGYTPVSLSSDASNNLLIEQYLASTPRIYQYFQAAGGTTIVQKDTTSGTAGTTVWTGLDFATVKGYNGSPSSVDSLCFSSLAACYGFKGSGTVLDGASGMAVDGAKTLWIADTLNATVQAAPLYTSSSYLQTVSSSQQVATNVYTHDSSNGSTLVAPAGIAIDNSGNVWVSNAGCTTTGCTPGSFVLSVIIGAAAPTITPISAQITGSNLAGTQP